MKREWDSLGQALTDAISAVGHLLFEEAIGTEQRHPLHVGETPAESCSLAKWTEKNQHLFSK